jgi:hypothetical protein
MILILFQSCKERKGKFSNIEISNLKRELQEIWELDQKYRSIAIELRKRNNGKRTQEEADLWLKQIEMDSINMVRVEKIISKYGYPDKSIVGEELKSVAAFVIIHNPSKQAKYLQLLWEESKRGNVDKREVAILDDRIQMLKGESQIYGTAMKYDSVSLDSNTLEIITKLKIWKVRDYSNLDKKREEVGWFSLKKQCELNKINIEEYPEYKHETNKYDW